MYKPENMTEDEYNDMIRNQVFLELFRTDMIRIQKRYKELMILVIHSSPKDREEYKKELKQNIESHLSKRDFMDDNKEFFISLKNFIETHPEIKQPDLDFVLKL